MRITAKLEKRRWTVQEKTDVVAKIELDEPLTVGETIEFQFPNSWSLVTGPSHTREFQTENPTGEHYVTVAAPDAEARFELEIHKRHVTHPKGLARHGRLMVATLKEGEIPAGKTIKVKYMNTFAANVTEVETLWLRVKGQAPEETLNLETLPGPGKTTRVLAPSVVRPDEEFEVSVVSLDQFGNVSSTSFSNERLLLTTGETVAEKLDFTGAVKTTTKLPAEGVFRFQFGDVISNAVKVDRNSPKVYWGDIHIHTKLSHDAEGSDPYGYARQASALDFAAVADHWESLGEEGYDIIDTWNEEAHQPGKFVTIPADERNARALTGHHNIYFRKPETFREHRELTLGYENIDVEKQGEDLRRLDPNEAMLIPHHTGISWGSGSPVNQRGSSVDWDAWDESERLRPVMEIYSHHGQSELYCPQHMLAYEFNRTRNPERRGNFCTAGPYYAQNYWMAGKRIGAIGSSDQHTGQGGKQHGGIAAALADDLDRDAIFDALLNRRCYASTGERILIELSVAGATMGEEISLNDGDPITINVKVWGTDLLNRVELMRHRFGGDDAFFPLQSLSPRPESMDADMTVEDTFEGPSAYYVRVTQEPLAWIDMAWSSPVWIDRNG